jgi:DNA-binding XRE family transcriptional regulator
MKQSAERRRHPEAEPVRVLGRGLRAKRGVRMTLRALRAAAGKTQTDVAKAARMDQADISRLERKADFDDCEVATLRRYIESLGGALEIVAVFGDKKITVAGVEPTRG